MLSRSRLPVDHPEYQYPPSKNPYWEKIKSFQRVVFSDHETESHRGQWRSQLQDDPQSKASTSDRKLCVEIGCNAGHVILEWAAQNPTTAYIGMDWKFKSIFRAAEKAQKRGLKNLLFFRAHAERLRHMFGPQEIDQLCLYFPDPWPRKSQWKHRFINPTRLTEIAQIMKPTGVFHIKTDHRGYYEWMREAIEATGNLWKIVEVSEDLHKDHPNPLKLQIPEVTLFEKLFIKDGIPIHSIKLQVK